jgi:hypothetical protein
MRFLFYKSVSAMNDKLDFATAVFADCSGKKLSAIEIADFACAIWRAIDLALSPTIGHKGVVALVKRSIYLQNQNYSALKTITNFKILVFPALHAILVTQTVSDAVAINNALLNTFYELLINLIGTPLSHRLLHSVLVTPSNGDPVQDTLS